jgi:diguanylate cyclase (GGDEF)-like protein
MGFGNSLRWMIGFLMLLVGVGIASPSSALSLAGKPLSVCIARAQPGLTPRVAFADPGRFDCTTSQARLHRGDFWILSQKLPDTATSPGLSIRFASLWQDRVTMYVRYADGAIRRAGFTSRTASQHLMLGATLALAIPHHDAPAVRVLWHVRGAANLRGVILGASLATHDEAADSEILLAALYGAFAGMAIALIVYNLALWAALRQRFQLVYCMLVLCLLTYAATSSGAIGQIFASLDNNDRLRLNGLFLAGSAILVLGFAQTFFERRVFAGWLGKASIGVMTAIGGSACAYAILSPWLMPVTDRLLTASYLSLICLVPVILWRAYRQRSNYLWMFALAWGAPVAFAGLRIASAFDLLGWSFWLDNSTIVSMMLEALLSSFAIAYRIRILSRERDEAREQEIAARLLAATDPLTGLLNRRAFLERSIGRDGDQMLLLADIDHFKRVNETIGHDGGDEVLRVFARALRAAVPPDALVARLGGEEFAIIAPADAGLAASMVLERLRTERMPFDLSVTASIGTCTGPLAREIDWKTLYRSADRALFEAKAAGRDRARDASGIAAAA